MRLSYRESFSLPQIILKVTPEFLHKSKSITFKRNRPVLKSISATWPFTKISHLSQTSLRSNSNSSWSRKCPNPEPAAAFGRPGLGNTLGARICLSRRCPRPALGAVPNVSSCGVQPRSHNRKTRCARSWCPPSPGAAPGPWGHGPAPPAPRSTGPRPPGPGFRRDFVRRRFPSPRSAGPRLCRCPCPGSAAARVPAVPVSPRSQCRRGCCAWAAGPGVRLRAGSACSCGRWWAAARPRRATAAPRSGRCTAQVTHPRCLGPAASPGWPCSGHSPSAATGPWGGRQAGTALLRSARAPQEGSGAGEGSAVQDPWGASEGAGGV